MRQRIEILYRRVRYGKPPLIEREADITTADLEAAAKFLRDYNRRHRQW